MHQFRQKKLVHQVRHNKTKHRVSFHMLKRHLPELQHDGMLMQNKTLNTALSVLTQHYERKTVRGACVTEAGEQRTCIVCENCGTCSKTAISICSVSWDRSACCRIRRITWGSRFCINVASVEERQDQSSENVHLLMLNHHMTESKRSGLEKQQAKRYIAA